jgi:hypothetical protein
VDERQEFVARCEYLQPFVDEALMTEESPRVRASVLLHCVVNLINSGTDDPNAAIEQFINTLRKTYEEKYGKK